MFALFNTKKSHYNKMTKRENGSGSPRFFGATREPRDDLFDGKPEEIARGEKMSQIVRGGCDKIGLLR